MVALLQAFVFKKYLPYESTKAIKKDFWELLALAPSPSFNYNDPLEQFQQVYILSDQYHCPVSLTSLSVSHLILNCFLFFVLAVLTANVKTLSGNTFLFLYKNTEVFVKTLIKDNSLTIKKAHFPVFFFFFLTLSLINLSGLIPYSWTISSWFTPVLLISMAFFFQIIHQTILNKSYFFFETFIPSGTPLVIVPFLTLIEIISYSSRVISLSIRLFANMLSGHALLKILISFAWTMVFTLTFSGIVGIVTIWGAVSVIFLLEIMVALLQAYVFILLLNIYLNESSHGH